ncbi:MAG: hypothetical protein IT299_11140 [Dehalococcoidia bacterium]|nr:hypothetical protein [Dehalococcoidia bacterium]
MPDEQTRAVSDRGDQTTPDEDLPSLSALPSQDRQRVRVRVHADGSAQVGRKRVKFGRSLAGALVTVEAE